MWKKIKNWWNREWSDYSFYNYVNTYSYDRLISKHEILKRVSNDGLIEYINS
jgi:hypothetical protein